MYNSGGTRGPNETRNIIIAIVLSAAVFFGFDYFYAGPQREKMQAAERARVEAQNAERDAAAQGSTIGSPDAPGASGPTSVRRDRVIAATANARIPIDTPSLDGSISLEGARFDDISLRGYCRTAERAEGGGCAPVDGQNGEVTLLSPITTQFGHDAFFGWEQQQGETARTISDAFTPWTADEGARLTPETPVTLTFEADGLRIERTLSIDANYMITIADTVHNSTGAAISARPFGTVRQSGLPQDYKFSGIVHQGLIGAFGPNNSLQQVAFKAAEKHAEERETGRAGADQRIRELSGQGGWLGLTDHYWLSAIIPDQGERVATYFDSRVTNNITDYRAAYRGNWRDIPAGGSATYTQRFYAGAKRVDVLQAYQNGTAAGGGAAIPRFDDAVDWGNFWFLTRPFFMLLHELAKFFGSMGIAFNFGLAIVCSTVVIKLLMFPLVYQSFTAMAKMRALQPKMKELQERYAADKQRQQQELLRLYQTEKINPVSGCVPILLQIPVFFALYKTLTVTIEMRHADFVGWIHDLSARDPTSVFNLFGLLPYDVSGVLGGALLIGAWPILYGVSMWLLQSLSPPATDPIQAQVFRLMPLLFTVMFAAFPAGLVIYWTWSNTLTMLQQYVIMRRQGMETQLDKFLKKRFGKEPATAE